MVPLGHDKQSLLSVNDGASLAIGGRRTGNQWGEPF